MMVHLFELKTKTSFQIQNSYACVQTNVFRNQETENVQIWLSLQSYVEPKEDDYFQVIPLPRISEAVNFTSHKENLEVKV